MDFEAIIKKHIGEDGSIPSSAISTVISDVKTAVGKEFVTTERYKAKLSEIDEFKTKLQDAEDSVHNAEKWKTKYDTLKGEFDGYKADEAKKAEIASKREAYKGLLKEIGISEKRFDSVLRIANLDLIEFDEDGKVKDVENVKKNMENEWSDYIVTTSERGANTDTPPSNTGGNTMTKEEIFRRENGKYVHSTEERQRAIAENLNLFHK